MADKNIDLQKLAERVYTGLVDDDTKLNSTVVSSFVKLLELANIDAIGEADMPEIHIHFVDALPEGVDA